MSLLTTLVSSMSSEDSVKSISKKTGLSTVAIGGLIAVAVPMLLKKLTSNASSQQGASSLLGALSQHTDTSSVADQIASADTADGSAIIGHILGSDQASSISQLAQQSNLTEDQVNTVLANIAPALMSGISAANTAQTTQQTQSASSPLSGIFGSLLGGGSSSSSSNPLGMLSSLFGGGKQEDASIDGSSLLSLLMSQGK